MNLFITQGEIQYYLPPIIFLIFIKVKKNTKYSIIIKHLQLYTNLSEIILIFKTALLKLLLPVLIDQNAQIIYKNKKKIIKNKFEL